MALFSDLQRWGNGGGIEGALCLNLQVLLSPPTEEKRGPRIDNSKSVCARLTNQSDTLCEGALGF